MKADFIANRTSKFLLETEDPLSGSVVLAGEPTCRGILAGTRDAVSNPTPS